MNKYREFYKENILLSKCNERKQNYLYGRKEKKRREFDSRRTTLNVETNDLTPVKTIKKSYKENFNQKLRNVKKNTVKKQPLRPFVVGVVRHKIHSPPFLNGPLKVKPQKKNNITTSVKSFAPRNYKFHPPKGLKINILTPVKQKIQNTSPIPFRSLLNSQGYNYTPKKNVNFENIAIRSRIRKISNSSPISTIPKTTEIKKEFHKNEYKNIKKQLKEETSVSSSLNLKDESLPTKENISSKSPMINHPSDSIQLKTKNVDSEENKGVQEDAVVMNMLRVSNKNDENSNSMQIKKIAPGNLESNFQVEQLITSNPKDSPTSSKINENLLDNTQLRIKDVNLKEVNKGVSEETVLNNLNCILNDQENITDLEQLKKISPIKLNLNLENKSTSTDTISTVSLGTVIKPLNSKVIEENDMNAAQTENKKMAEQTDIDNSSQPIVKLIVAEKNMNNQDNDFEHNKLVFSPKTSILKTPDRLHLSESEIKRMSLTITNNILSSRILLKDFGYEIKMEITPLRKKERKSIKENLDNKNMNNNPTNFLRTEQCEIIDLLDSPEIQEKLVVNDTSNINKMCNKSFRNSSFNKSPVASFKYQIKSPLTENLISNKITHKEGMQAGTAGPHIENKSDTIINLSNSVKLQDDALNTSETQKSIESPIVFCNSQKNENEIIDIVSDDEEEYTSYLSRVLTTYASPNVLCPKKMSPIGIIPEINISPCKTPGSETLLKKDSPKVITPASPVRVLHLRNKNIDVTPSPKKATPRKLRATPCKIPEPQILSKENSPNIVAAPSPMRVLNLRKKKVDITPSPKKMTPQKGETSDLSRVLAVHASPNVVSPKRNSGRKALSSIENIPEINISPCETPGSETLLKKDSPKLITPASPVRVLCLRNKNVDVTPSPKKATPRKLRATPCKIPDPQILSKENSPNIVAAPSPMRVLSLRSRKVGITPSPKKKSSRI